MVKCKRCNGKIKQSTANKYNGYSRYCLAQIEKENETVQEIPNDQPITELNNEEYQYYLEKLRALIVKPKFYTKKEFNYIYGIPERNESYFNRYLDRTIGNLLEDSFLMVPNK